MTKRVTSILAGLLCLLLAGSAVAQNVVTVRDINQVAQDSIDALKAGGTTLTLSDIDRAVQSSLTGETVTITVVLLTDPLLSGLRSVDNPGTADEKIPIHAFVRDTSAASQGPDGMGIQIFDDEPVSTGMSSATWGDVLTLNGTVSYFSGGQLQFGVTSVTLLGDYVALGLDPSVVAPVLVTTSDVNAPIDLGGGVSEVQTNWDNFVALNGQYVRIENAKVLDRILSSTSNPQVLVSSDNSASYIQFDTRYSVRYNNSRNGSAYPPQFGFLTRDSNDPYEPPAIGSTVNIEGFVLYESTSFEFGTFGAEPNGAWLSLAPFFDGDVEITAEPSVTGITINLLDFVPGTDPVTVTATVQSQPGAVATVVAEYVATTGETGTVTMADQGAGLYSADIPSVPEGAFVTYTITVTDTDGISFESDNEGIYRALADGINQIEDIQLTPDGGPGDSPFIGATLAMDIEATVNNKPDSSGWLVVQDDADLAPWSGILLEVTDDVAALGLKPGDVVNVTSGTPDEIRGIRYDRSGEVTALRSPVVSVLSTGGAPLGYKLVTTDVLQINAAAEAHEDMMIRFESVVITTNNADGPDNNFGEFAVSSDASETNQLRVDDASSGIPFGYNDTVSAGERLAFVQGVWSDIFGDFKLLPEDLTDIGDVTNVATEGLEVPEEYALGQNYPNPFNPATTIQYDVPGTSHVTISVFDMIGRKVTTLVDGAVGPGTHSVAFDARGLASGLYIYRLEAAGVVFNRSMLLLK